MTKLNYLPVLKFSAWRRIKFPAILGEQKIGRFHNDRKWHGSPENPCGKEEHGVRAWQARRWIHNVRGIQEEEILSEGTRGRPVSFRCIVCPIFEEKTCVWIQQEFHVQSTVWSTVSFPPTVLPRRQLTWVLFEFVCKKSLSAWDF